MTTVGRQRVKFHSVVRYAGGYESWS